MTNANANDAAIRAFVAAFESKLAPFPHPDVVIRNYGDPEITGREQPQSR